MSLDDVVWKRIWWATCWTLGQSLDDKVWAHILMNDVWRAETIAGRCIIAVRFMPKNKGGMGTKAGSTVSNNRKKKSVARNRVSKRCFALSSLCILVRLVLIIDRSYKGEQHPKFSISVLILGFTVLGPYENVHQGRACHWPRPAAISLSNTDHRQCALPSTESFLVPLIFLVSISFFVSDAQ